MADKRFLASATVEELDGFDKAADLLTVLLEMPEVREAVLLDAAGFATGFGLDELTEVAGFRAVVEAAAPLARFSARVSVLPGEWWAGARDVLRGAAESGFFFSSPEPPIDA